MKKKNEYKYSYIALALPFVTILLFLIFLGGNIGNTVSSEDSKDVTVNGFDKEDIANMAIKAMNSYDYVDVISSMSVSDSDGESLNVTNYMYNTSKDNKCPHNFTEYSNDMSYIYSMAWEESDNGYSTYVYEDIVSEWVYYGESEEEPFNMTPYECLNEVSLLSLYPEVTEYLGTTCYNLQYFSNTDNSDLVGSSIFIDSSTMLPIAVISYVELTTSVEEYADDGTPITITEYCMVNEFEWTDTCNGEIPSNYINESEYLSMLEDISSEEDLGDEESEY